MRAFIDDRMIVVASTALIAELERVLARPKLTRRAQRREFVDRVRRHASVLDDPVEVPAAARDPKDDYLIALGGREAVDAVISGDGDLLEAELDDLAVWSPRHLADRLAPESGPDHKPSRNEPVGANFRPLRWRSGLAEYRRFAGNP
jgi:predicted nucleic acid-binding protein